MCHSILGEQGSIGGEVFRYKRQSRLFQMERHSTGWEYTGQPSPCASTEIEALLNLNASSQSPNKCIRESGMFALERDFIAAVVILNQKIVRNTLPFFTKELLNVCRKLVKT